MTRSGLVDSLAKFEATMQDDFNTAKAIGDLSEVFKAINEILDKPGDADTDARTLRAIREAVADVGATLGLFTEDPKAVIERMEQIRTTDQRDLYF